MSKQILFRIFLSWLFVDSACLAITKRDSWIFDFGVRGLVIDFLFGIVVVVLHIRESEES